MWYNVLFYAGDAMLVMTMCAMLQVVVLYDYEAQGEQELDLNEGDIVTIVTKEDDVWWCGQIRGKQGMFPSTYVEAYVEN